MITPDKSKPLGEVNKSDSVPKGFYCSTCGKYHDEVPMDWGFSAPYQWNPEFVKRDPKKNEISSDMCVINGENFFIRGIIEIPIINENKTFNWGVWVSLSEKSFARYMAVYKTEKELDEEPYFGWLCNKIPGYPNTISLKTSVHLQGNRLRPKIVLDHSDLHPLCQEQHNGITMHRVGEIFKRCSHGEYFPKEVRVQKQFFVNLILIFILIVVIMAPFGYHGTFQEKVSEMMEAIIFWIVVFGFWGLLSYFTLKLETTANKELVYKSIDFKWRKAVRIENILACYCIPIIKRPITIFVRMLIVYVNDKNRIDKMAINISSFKLKDVADVLKGFLAVRPQTELDEYGESFVNGEYFKKNRR